MKKIFDFYFNGSFLLCIACLARIHVTYWNDLPETVTSAVELSSPKSLDTTSLYSPVSSVFAELIVNTALLSFSDNCTWSPDTSLLPSLNLFQEISYINKIYLIILLTFSFIMSKSHHDYRVQRILKKEDRYDQTSHKGFP